jgi:hypothetical protein
MSHLAARTSKPFGGKQTRCTRHRLRVFDTNATEAGGKGKVGAGDSGTGGGRMTSKTVYQYHGSTSLCSSSLTVAIGFIGYQSTRGTLQSQSCLLFRNGK